ncbi:MAG: hypothetical protein GKR95_13975 [Gammaproteobacteria bacterium]|nr:hypothetical protein [Gammaproteobacteria bacterium]
MIQDATNTWSLLIHMMASISLLLWGSHTVRNSVERSFASTLNRLVAGASAAPFKAIASGVIAALLMQSATATALLATGLLTSGTLTLVAAMAIVLGADLGSAIAARILYVDLSLMPSILLVVGMLLNLSMSTWRGKCFGRILLGLGLMLISIQLMKHTIAPLTAIPLPDEWLLILKSVPWLAMILVAGATWFSHSSVAMVLVIAALSQSRLLPPDLFAPMLLGVNIGAGLIVLPMVGISNTEARSVVISNILLRTTFGLILLFTVPFWIEFLPRLSPQPGSQVVFLHIGFNLLLVILFFPFSAKLVTRVLDKLNQRELERSASLSIAAGSGLDPSMLQQPTSALSSARREAYRLGDITETLFSRALGMFAADDQSQIERIVESDREINARNRVIHQYLSEARRHISDAGLERSLDEILQFASTMENIGDIISHNLSRLAEKRLGRGVMFSTEGMHEIQHIHAEVLALLGSEINRFASNGEIEPKKTYKQVDHIRLLCNKSIAKHRRRLSDHKANSMGTSSIHQDTVRDLLQVAILVEHMAIRD